MTVNDSTAEKYLYYPERLPPGMPPPRWAAGSEEAWIETEDGVRIHGLWWSRPSGRPVVLFLHGNAQEAYSWSLVRHELAPMDCRMLLIDYRGYGKSEGDPSEKGLYLDGAAALRWLEEQGVEPEQLLVFGKSLGGAVACEISQGLPLKGLILESTFTSLRSVARNLFPAGAGYVPLEGAFDSLEKLPRITCPLLVVHGDEDALIPASEGMDLFEAANEPKQLYLVCGAGHNDVSMVGGREYGEHLRSWLDRLEG